MHKLKHLYWLVFVILPIFGFSQNFADKSYYLVDSLDLSQLSQNEVDLVENQKDRIDKTFENWKGDLEQIDDVCVIGVRV